MQINNMMDLLEHVQKTEKLLYQPLTFLARCHQRVKQMLGNQTATPITKKIKISIGDCRIGMTPFYISKNDHSFKKSLNIRA